jgi:hypothetical protein
MNISQLILLISGSSKSSSSNSSRTCGGGHHCSGRICQSLAGCCRASAAAHSRNAVTARGVQLLCRSSSSRIYLSCAWCGSRAAALCTGHPLHMPELLTVATPHAQQHLGLKIQQNRCSPSMQ